MKKLLIYTLIGVVLFAIFATAYYSNKYQKQIDQLSNQLAQAQKETQETKSAFSAQGQKYDDLQSENKDLENKIKSRDEDIAAMGSAIIKWKDQYFQIKNAKQTVVDKNGNNTTESSTCDQRLKVEFDKNQDLWHVKGSCITNPAEAEVNVSWLRPLKLSFVLTKKDNNYRLYLDSDSPDTVLVDNLQLKVDPSVYNRSWYEKIAVGFDLGLTGNDPLAGIRGYYEISNFAVGPFMLLYNGKTGLQRAYGASVNWFPFAKQR